MSNPVSKSHDVDAKSGFLRGRDPVETCKLNGWGVGTVLRGHEGWSNGKGVWSTIRITGLGEQTLLARCIKHERTQDGRITETFACIHWENSWTLSQREWTEVVQ